MSKRRTGIQNAGTQLYVDQVRCELYGVMNDIRERWNCHLLAFGSEHKKPCLVCRDFYAETNGVREAIRHFGGTPHWISRPEGW